MPRALEEAAHHYNLGIEYERDRKFEEAKKQFRLACQMDPQFAYPHKALGDLLRQEDKLVEAAESFGRALQIDPGWHEATAALASVYYHLGRNEEAIELQKAVLKKEPNNPDHYSLLGKMFIAAKRHSEAVEILQAALNKDPKSYSLQYSLGLAYGKRAMEDIDRSIACWEKARLINSDDPQLHRSLGISYYAKGMLNEAGAAFEKALQLNASDEVAKRFLELTKRLQS